MTYANGNTHATKGADPGLIVFSIAPGGSLDDVNDTALGFFTAHARTNSI
jgi:hypothetical protein